MESARGPGSPCPLQTSRTHIIHLQSTKHSRKLQSTKTTPFTKEKTMRVGQRSHTFTNMKRDSPTQMACLGRWEKMLDCQPPLSLVLPMEWCSLWFTQGGSFCGSSSYFWACKEAQNSWNQTPTPVPLLCWNSHVMQSGQGVSPSETAVPVTIGSYNVCGCVPTACPAPDMNYRPSSPRAMGKCCMRNQSPVP